MTTSTIIAVILAALSCILLSLWLFERHRAGSLRRAKESGIAHVGDLARVGRETVVHAGGQAQTILVPEAISRRVVENRDTARAWYRELRGQLADAYEHAGLIGDPGDSRTLVLRVAIDLLGATKGLLLANEDVDGDGNLDLVAVQGFDSDPEQSPVVQQLARRTLSAQETLRVDDPAAFAGENGGDSDELENLVAIPIYIRDEFQGVVVAANKPGGFDEFDDDLLLALGDQAGAVLQNARLHGRLRNSYVATVRVLAEAIEAKDPFLRGHCDEVSALVGAVGRRLELGPKEREDLLFASLLHDIGKIGISEGILQKPGPLTPEERLIVQLHPRIGFSLLNQVPDLQSIGLAVLHHHERWDGEGYPDGLKGEAIPLDARLIAIADAFSAMISERPYGTRLSPSEACEDLVANAGSQFDPDLVGLFCEEVSLREGELRVDGAVDRALDDPELQQLREADEPLFGAHAFAATDNTTLLYSHRHLQEEARAHAKAAVAGRPFTVVVLELVELEQINRDAGYGAGDQALNLAARQADRIAVESGGIAARLSGRRLAILIPGVDDDQVRRLAEDLSPDVSLRLSAAGWREGDSGEDVIARARTATSVVLA